ncbi:hypothetical protein CHS0354_001526 [Potamilus streckersoni]|uniref:Uncharacterized protein n=1 Tax=Potamilus streckersoni TaxID=2493646 RepID=A0AAE0VZF4_9BIVA|nr:hypothetical protein CHS0354_001526 [Potamilus streckersoni]
MCGTHEQCVNVYGLTNELELRYSMGCISDRACNLMYTLGGPSVGHPNSSLFLSPIPVVEHRSVQVRRDLREIYELNKIKREVRDISFEPQIRRDVSSKFMVTSCEYCCSDSYCNNKECVTGFAVTQKSIAILTTMASTNRTTKSMPVSLAVSTTMAVPTRTTSIVSTRMSTTSTASTLTTSITATTSQPSNANVTKPNVMHIVGRLGRYNNVRPVCSKYCEDAEVSWSARGTGIT